MDLPSHVNLVLGAAGTAVAFPATIRTMFDTATASKIVWACMIAMWVVVILNCVTLWFGLFNSVIPIVVACSSVVGVTIVLMAGNVWSERKAPKMREIMAEAAAERERLMREQSPEGP